MDIIHLTRYCIENNFFSLQLFFLKKDYLKAKYIFFIRACAIWRKTIFLSLLTRDSSLSIGPIINNTNVHHSSLKRFTKAVTIFGLNLAPCFIPTDFARIKNKPRASRSSTCRSPMIYYHEALRAIESTVRRSGARSIFFLFLRELLGKLICSFTTFRCGDR